MRQRFQKGQGGSLRFRPPEGAPTSGTVTLKTAQGVDLPTPVVDQAATVAGTDLTFALTAANTPEPLSWGNLYRAAWTYVVGGASYTAEQLYEVNLALLKPTLDLEEVRDELPADWTELLADGETRAQRIFERAWDDLLDDLAARGWKPDRIRDPERMRRPHRAKVLAMLGTAFGPDWKDWAVARAADYDTAMDVALQAGDWYDVVEDQVMAPGEVKWSEITLTR
jgi:hypothetical protein